MLEHLPRPAQDASGMIGDAPITILGANGWIGSALVAALERQGKSVHSVGRTTLSTWLAANEPLGPVIFAIGLTADFRQRPHATVAAHVSLLSQVMQRQGLAQLLYLSSTRVYSRSQETEENSCLPCLSSDPSDLYNLSKLLGEALVLQDPRPGLRVVRLSNVIGPNQPATTFIGALLSEAKDKGHVTIKQPSSTTKDYISMDDVVRLIPQILERGNHRLYNLGTGMNFSHADVAGWLERQGVMVRFSSDPDYSVNFPPLRVTRLLDEFELLTNPFGQTLL
jgi:nucleoside-diphosphate-sugar epimerase